MSRLLKTCSLRGFGLRCLAVLAVMTAAPAIAQSPFGGGNIVVNRVGVVGGPTLSATSTQISIMEFTTTGSNVQTIVFGTTAPDPQTDSGSATSNGFISVYNGFLSVPGYNNNIGTTAVAGLNTKVNSTLDMSGTLVSRTLFPTDATIYGGNNYRSSIATSGSTFYSAGTGSGTTGGVWYNDGTTFTRISGTEAANNIRNVEIYNNQLFYSSASGTFLGVASLGTGLPTSGPQAGPLLLTSTGAASAYGFVLFSTGSNGAGVLDLAYVADDRANALAGGIQRFALSSGTWGLTGALRFDTTTNLLSGSTAGVVSIRGLAGSYDSLTGAATLFATTTETNNNRLISFVDSGSGLVAGGTFTTLALAGTNNAFRGVDIIPVPVPEPSTLVLAGIGLGAAGWTAMRRRSPRRPSA
jgi:hypothetical protein